MGAKTNGCVFCISALKTIEIAKKPRGTRAIKRREADGAKLSKMRTSGEASLHGYAQVVWGWREKNNVSLLLRAEASSLSLCIVDAKEMAAMLPPPPPPRRCKHIK